MPEYKRLLHIYEFQERDPLEAVYRKNRALCYWKMGDLYNAIRDYRKAIELAPGFIYCRIDLIEVLLQAGKYEEAKIGDKNLGL